LINEKSVCCIEFPCYLSPVLKLDWRRNLPNAFSEYETIKDIVYGPEPWQKIGCVCAAHSSLNRFAVGGFLLTAVVWERWLKDMYPFVGEIFAKQVLHHRDCRLQ